MKWLIAIALLGCGSSPPPGGTASGGPGTATSGGPAGTGSANSGNAAASGNTAASAGPACDAARAKVSQLYRAEAQTREPKRVDEAVADNTAMVMRDCAKAPAKVAACLAAVATVADLEAKCLVALDDEGSEGDQLAH